MHIVKIITMSLILNDIYRFNLRLFILTYVVSELASASASTPELLINCQSTVSQSTVNQLSINCQSTVNQLSINCQSTVNQLSCNTES